MRRNWRGEDGERGPLLDRRALIADRTARAETTVALLGLEGEAAR